MNHIQIGVLSADLEGSEYVANSWGKKSTTSDITIYTTKNSKFLQTTIIPSGFPRKMLPLIITAHMSDSIVLGVSKLGLDQYTGEMAILADTLGLKGLYAVIGRDTTGLDTYLDQMEKVFSKLSLSSWESMMINDSEGFSQARKTLYSMHQKPRGNAESYLAIEVDHTFPVQGVGSVVLGNITSGTIKKGQKIITYPSGQTGQIRSIQVNDEEAKVATAGAHVGLAIKGVLPKYLQRGTVIANQEDQSVLELDHLESIKIRKAAFGKSPQKGQRIHVVSGLYDSPGEIIKWNETVTLKLDKMIPYYPDTRLTILDLNAKPAVLGSKL
ncbi:MAG: EF-Tu/IF-2/RF-3 family GTPase [Candidatus Heimdallarchaeota archaeon]